MSNLSRRDEFAKAAMQGMLACPEVSVTENIPKYAIQCADALLTALGDEPDTHEACCSLSFHNSLLRDKVVEIARITDDHAKMRVSADTYRQERNAAREVITDYSLRIQGFMSDMAEAQAEIASLKAELAKYTGDLTDEQAQAAWDLWDGVGDMAMGMKIRDVAIRKVRAGGGE